MEKPNPETVAFFERHLPDDVRVRRGAMFGHPCAFVNGNMFYGTFGQSLVIRVGAREAMVRVGEGISLFEPMQGRAWRDYVQVAKGAIDEGTLRELVEAALDHAAGLPPKVAGAAPKVAKAAKGAVAEKATKKKA